MIRPPTEADLPAALLGALPEKLDRLRRLEQAVATDLFQPWRAHMPRLMDSVETWFVRHFMLNQPIGPTQDLRWNLIDARRLKAVEWLTQEIQRTLVAIAEEQATALDEAILDAADEGAIGAIWDLDVLGADDEELARADAAVPHERSQLRAWLLPLLVFGGLTYRQRTQAHIEAVAQRAHQWVKATVVAEEPFPTTAEGVKRAVADATKRVVALSGDEMHRAAGLAAHAVFAQSPRIIGEMWVTQDDEKVCDICAPLHLQTTWKQPVTHSHPRCRCWKVPIPEHYQNRPESLADLQRRVQRMKFRPQPPYQGGEYYRWEHSRWSRIRIPL